MPKFAACLALLVLIPAFAHSARAQDVAQPADAAKRPAHFYRLNFVLAEFDSAKKPINSRSFSTIVGTVGTRSGSFVVGSKIPLITGTQPSKDDPGKLSTEFQFIDVGIKIMASDVHEYGDRLAFNLHAEVSSMASSPKVLNGNSEPVLRENVWSGDVLIAVGKPAAVFKSDSLEDTGTMQLEVTATPVE